MVGINNSTANLAVYSRIGELSDFRIHSDDLYDLDIEIIAPSREETTGVPPQGLAAITSKSLCTPGCGNTGTMNSFCCW